MIYLFVSILIVNFAVGIELNKLKTNNYENIER